MSKNTHPLFLHLSISPSPSSIKLCCSASTSTVVPQHHRPFPSIPSSHSHFLLTRFSISYLLVSCRSLPRPLHPYRMFTRLFIVLPCSQFPLRLLLLLCLLLVLSLSSLDVVISYFERNKGGCEEWLQVRKRGRMSGS